MPLIQNLNKLQFYYCKFFVECPLSPSLLLGQRLLQRVSADGGGGGGREAESPSGGSQNDDTRSLVLHNLEAVHASQKHLLQLWHHKKLKLDQCFQLRLFEQDCEKVRLIVTEIKRGHLNMVTYESLPNAFVSGKLMIKAIVLFLLIVCAAYVTVNCGIVPTNWLAILADCRVI